jgi:hypothetical protein
LNLPSRKGLCLSISFLCMWQGGKRSDGRTPHEIRPINSSCGLLPRAHGSALFTRGETQVCGDFSLSPNFMFWCCGTVFIYAPAAMRPKSKQGKVSVSYLHQTQAPLRYFMMCRKSIPIYLHIFKIILKDTFWILFNTPYSWILDNFFIGLEFYWRCFCWYPDIGVGGWWWLNFFLICVNY